MTDATQTRGRGRPRAARRADVAATGLRLFQENGFDETTMDEIAEAAGISRPTLFRYFPSKAGIVWHGSDRDARWLRDALKNASPARTPLDVLCDVLPHLIRSDDTELGMLRTQVSIIMSVPTVQAQTSERMKEFIDIVAEFVADRTGLQPTDLIPQVATRAAWEASWAALGMWAASDDDVPTLWLVKAFDALRVGFATEAL